MMLKNYLSILCLITFSFLLAQNNENSNQCQLLKEIENDFESGDSIGLLENLSKYILNFPTGFESINFSLNILEYNISQESHETALNFLKNKIDNGINQRYSLPIDCFDTSKFEFKLQRGSPIKTRVALKIAEYYAKHRDSNQTDYYIQKSFEYIPIDCVNGYFMYKNMYSIPASDAYLEVGNINKATEILVENFLNKDGYRNKEVTKKLKSLLLSSYSQKEIQNEVDRAISNIKIVNKNNHFFSELEIFGFKYSEHISTNDLEIVKNNYLNNPLIEELKK